MSACSCARLVVRLVSSLFVCSFECLFVGSVGSLPTRLQVFLLVGLLVRLFFGCVSVCLFFVFVDWIGWLVAGLWLYSIIRLVVCLFDCLFDCPVG